MKDNKKFEDAINSIVNVKFTLRGQFCNEYPLCCIQINKNVIFDGRVEGFVVVDVPVLLIANNTIQITHYGKRLGENRIWDTKVDNGNIIADRSLHVDDISILDISLKPWWHKGKMSNGDLIPKHSDTIHFFLNGEYMFNFTAPFYDWLIDSQHDGFKEIGPLWKLSSLNTRPDGYSSSMLELEPILDRIQKSIDKL